MNLFIVSKIIDNYGELSEEETHHCINVLRFKIGQKIHCIDGKGTYYKGEIHRIEKSRLIFIVHESYENWQEPPNEIHLLVPLLKKKAMMELMVQKSTELGASHIHFINCEHSERKTLDIERLKLVAINAVKQCQRSRIPVLDSVSTLEDKLIEMKEKIEFKLFGDLESDESLSLNSPVIKQIENSNVLIAVGPEGDFSKDEYKLLREHQFNGFKLGKQRMKAETAIIYFLSIIKLLQQY